MKDKFFLLVFLVISVFLAIYSVVYLSDVFNSKELAIESSMRSSIILNSLNSEIELKNYKLEKEKLSNLSFVFVGDIMLSRSVGAEMKELNDYKFPFKKSYGFLNSADISFANLENPISSRGINQGSIYSFRANPNVIDGLKYSGVDVLSVANNHILDWGRYALVDTLGILKKSNILSVGAGINYVDANSVKIINIKNKKIGFLAYTPLYPKSLYATSKTPGVSDFNLDKIYKYVNKLKSDNNLDLLVVSLHWGTEYNKEPSDWQIRVAHKLIDSGVNIVVGHHPHVAQKIERYKNGLIMYSLGNFIFDQSFSYDTMHSIAIKVLFNMDKIKSVDKYLVKINENYQPSVVQ